MRNNYFVEGDMVKIELDRKDGRKEYAIVSLESLDLLKTLDVKWCFLDQGVNTCYVMASFYTGNKKKKTIRLHRFLTKADKGLVVNHINGNGLDNTLGNLEVVTNQVNTIKRVNKNSNNTSGIRGVSYSEDRNKYEVKFRKNYKTYHFGRFKTLEEAEIIAEQKFKELFSEYL